MKKIAIVSGILFTLSTAGIFSLYDPKQEVEASSPKSFKIMSTDKLGYGENLIVVKHKKTGCYYTHMDGNNSEALTQMFVEKNGVNVPYCSK